MGLRPRARLEGIAMELFTQLFGDLLAEACDTYKPWHDKHTHRTFLRPDTGKCLHYYFWLFADSGG